MLKNRIFIITMCFASLQLLQFAQNKSYAKIEALVKEYNDDYIDHDQGAGAEKKEEEKKYRYEYIYEDATVQALAYLYFGIGLYKTDNDWAVNEFLKTNECDLYNKYGSNALDWQEVIDATKSYIEVNKQDFPTRFEFPLPIFLDTYDEKTQTYSIQDGFQIESLRRFELYASNYKDNECFKSARLGTTLPRGIVLEFSRPFTLLKVPMQKAQAESFLRERLEEVKNKYRSMNKKAIEEFKDVYLFLNVKIFTHGKILGVTSRDILSVQLMGILEGYSLYEDIDKKKLIYEHIFITQKRATGEKINVAYEDQYKILREKSKGAGILH